MPEEPKSEFHLAYELARESCQAFLLRIDQNSSGQAVCHPGFVGRRIVVGVGAEFEPDKISLDAVRSRKEKLPASGASAQDVIPQVRRRQIELPL